MKGLFGVLLIIIVLSGCSGGAYKPGGRTVDVVHELRMARSQLLDGVITPLDKEKPLLATSLVDIDDLTLSSTFGRMASEVMSAGMTERGYKVIEVKMRDSLFIQQQAGEFMLSRQVQDLSQEHDAQAVLLGTYAIASSHVFVNVRLVRSTDNIVISSHNFQLPYSSDVDSMLGLSSRHR